MGVTSPSSQTSVVSSNVSGMKKIAEALKCAVSEWVSKKRSKTASHLHHMRCHRDLREECMPTDDVSDSNSVVELPSTTIDDSEPRTIAHGYSDDESICSASQQSIEESMDSNCSMSSTRSTRSSCKLLADSSGFFKNTFSKGERRDVRGMRQNFQTIMQTCEIL